MLRDARAGCGGNERRRGRDVERLSAVSARSGRVDEIGRALGMTGTTCSRNATAQPAISSAVSPFARRATRKPAVWAWVASPAMISPIAAHRLALIERPAVEQLGDGVLDHSRASRKFRSRSRPSGSVSTDSGWNWTPSTAGVRWRTAITSPSSARRGNLELVGDVLCGERVVATGGEALRQPGEDAAAVVVDRRSLCRGGARCACADLAAERRDDRLVAEADAERGRGRREARAISRAWLRSPPAARAPARRRDASARAALPRRP